MREHLTVLSHSCVLQKYSPYGDGKENDKMKSYEQKILAWDGADFHELAASMGQEEVNSMAFEAEIADDEDLAYIIYDLMDEMD